MTNLSPDDIRPPDLEAGKLDALEEDLVWLRERRAQFVTVGCPACATASTEAAPAFEKYGFSFLQCDSCGTAYMSPRATPAILNEFYTGSRLYAYWDKWIFPASEAARRERIFRPRVEQTVNLCREHGVKTGTLMEVGAAHGIFCEELMKTGIFSRVIAVEPGDALSATARERGLEVIAAPIDQVDLPDASIDVVAAFEVIEHLYDPADFLAHCQRLLTDDGLIIVTCPNYAGFDIQSLGQASESLDAEHINMFTPDALQRLFERLGFEVLSVTTPGRLDAEIVRNAALSGTIDLSEQPFLRQVLLDRWDGLGGPFQDFLVANSLSSHMWMAARVPTR